TTNLSASPSDLGLLSGPVLAADRGGAWLIGTDDKRGGVLTRAPIGADGKRDHRLDLEPAAVAVGEGAVWITGHADHDDEVLRVNPATGRVRARTHLPSSARIASIEAGLGAVWVVSPSTATLYRIDPRSSRLTGHLDLGKRAGRPELRSGLVWVGVSDDGGQTLLVDPRTLRVVRPPAGCRHRQG